MLEKLKKVASLFKQELGVYRLVLKDKRTPRIARITLGLAVGYLLLPFDLIPDWIPIVGHLDDLVVVPVLVIMALKFIPAIVIQEARECVRKNQEGVN